MEDSSAENAQTAELAWLHEMVMKVKSDREVGLAYMKSFEAEKRIRDEGKAEGKAEAIMDLLKDIGSISEDVEKRLQEQKDLEVLGNWLKLAAHARSIDEFERQIQAESYISDPVG